jgi:GT2 family glycosyltransferase
MASAAHPADARAAAEDRSARGRLSVIVVDHRRPDILAQALTSLYASRRRPDEIIVVDVESASQPSLPADPTPEDGLQTRVVRVIENPGYSAACNRGSAAASGDWLLFMNSDVMVDADCLGDVLAAVDGDASIGIATCRLRRPDGRLDHACHRGIPSVFDSLAYKSGLDRLRPGSRRLGHYRLTWLDPAETHDVEACTGAFLLIRRKAFEAVGGWDEAYWFYAEDLDLCLRTSQLGWRVRYVATASAVHLKGASSNLRADERTLSPAQAETRRRVQRAIVDSHERFYRQHLEATTARPVRPLVRLMFALQRRMAGGIA